MPDTIHAIFKGGAFLPKEPVNLAEGDNVTLQYEKDTEPPFVTDPEERKRLLKQVFERMASNPIPPNAPRFTRDELHDRSKR